MFFQTKKYVYAAALALIVLLPGCRIWQCKKDSEQGQASSAQALAQARDNKLYVINVLEKSLYDDCHIKGSINVPYEGVDAFVSNLSKDVQMVVYCSNYQCTASHQIAKKLIDQGFTQVWAYEGGMAQWYQMGAQDSSQRANYPIEGACSPQRNGYLTKEIERSNDEPTVPVIDAQELRQKMVEHNLL